MKIKTLVLLRFTVKCDTYLLQGLNYVQEGDESKDGLKVQRMSLKLYLNDG
jgi:hypothetical protein